MSEDDFQRRVIHTAKLYGWLVHHARPAFNKSGKFATPIQGHKGAPDLLLARCGVVILAELKRDRGSLTAEQKDWRAETGGHARVWRPRDWPEVLAELSAPRPDGTVVDPDAPDTSDCACPFCPPSTP